MPIPSNTKDALIAGAFGVVGTLITLVLDWAKDRSVSARHTRALHDATKRATFWDTWLKTQLAITANEEQVSRVKNKAQSELAALESIMEAAFPDSALNVHAAMVQSDEYRQIRSSMPWFRRWLLLYMPARPLGWVPRVFFYMVVAESIAFPFNMLDPSERTGWQYGVIGLVFLIAVFRGLSLRIEKPRINSTRAH